RGADSVLGGLARGVLLDAADEALAGGVAEADREGDAGGERGGLRPLDGRPGADAAEGAGDPAGHATEVVGGALARGAPPLRRRSCRAPPAPAPSLSPPPPAPPSGPRRRAPPARAGRQAQRADPRPAPAAPARGRRGPAAGADAEADGDARRSCGGGERGARD